MGIFNRKKRAANINNTQLRSIIKEYYGKDTLAFARTYASNIYSIPEVRTAIECVADIFSVIPRKHERVKDNDVNVIKNSAFNRVINLKPNPLQNATQFWKEAITRLLLTNNLFIEARTDASGELKCLYNLPTKNFKFEYINDKKATVTFYDAVKGDKTYDMDEIIYINRFSSLAGGQKNDLGLYETVVQALMQQALEVANPRKPRAIMQGIIGQSNNLKPKDKKGTMEDVKASFDDTVNGIVYFDNQWQITPINWNENDVNRELMKLVINTVYNYFGITDTIINCKATEIEFEMFVKNKIEPLARQFEAELTTKLFTEREVQVGDRIEFDTFTLSVSTLSAKTALFNVAIRNGIMNQDDCRGMIGLGAIPDGLGKKFRVSADTVDLGIVDSYQLGKVNKNKNDKKEGDEGDGEEGTV